MLHWLRAFASLVGISGPSGPAARVPLLRAEGKVFSEGYPTLGPADLLTVTLLRRESRSDRTREAEASFGFQPSLYFYVGFSHPSFGEAVLVYAPESFDRDQGGATPFDSGGFHLDHIVVGGVTSSSAKRAYVEQHDVRLRAWRRHFARYMAAHFESPIAYVQGRRPTRDDRSHRLRDGTDRRAWTWELRLHRDHPVMDHLQRAYLSFDYEQELREHLRTGDPGLMAVWSRRFREGIIRGVEPGQSPHHVALDEIARALR
jgi:hypothetical protein